MRSSDRVIWDFVQQWLSKAEQDLQVARILLASDIGEFGVDFRYPGDLGSIPLSQGEEALRLAEETWTKVQTSLSSYLAAGRPGGDG